MSTSAVCACRFVQFKTLVDAHPQNAYVAANLVCMYKAHAHPWQHLQCVHVALCGFEPLLMHTHKAHMHLQSSS